MSKFQQHQRNISLNLSCHTNFAHNTFNKVSDDLNTETREREIEREKKTKPDAFCFASEQTLSTFDKFMTTNVTWTCIAINKISICSASWTREMCVFCDWNRWIRFFSSLFILNLHFLFHIGFVILNITVFTGHIRQTLAAIWFRAKNILVSTAKKMAEIKTKRKSE